MMGFFDGVGLFAPRAGTSPATARVLLEETRDFGPNPGALRMLTYDPPGRQRRAPLVVVLHGCTQTADGFDAGSGWSKLAERAGFVLLYPEQSRSNNPRGCFNWFDPVDTAAVGGEAQSIRDMIEILVKRRGLDSRRIYVCGLSAGGAMAAALLARFPGLFKAGAILAGLPFGAAASVGEALEAMYNGRIKPARAWGDLVRGASAHAGPWPAVSVWHGSNDRTVKVINAGEIVKQWTNVHSLKSAPDVQALDGITRRAWRDSSGAAPVVEYSVPGMGHGVPLRGDGAPDDGAIGPFFLKAGLWSSFQIARDWGLIGIAGQTRRRRLLPFFRMRF